MAQIEDTVTTRSTNDASSREIRADIERTRAEMDETFNAIEDKLTPGQLLMEGWNLFKGGSSAGTSKMMHIAKEHPLPSAVIALGFGWLLLDSSRDKSERRDRTRSSSRGVGAQYGYSAQGFATTGEYGRYGETWDTEERSGRLSSAADAVKGAAHSVKETAGDVTHRAGEVASHAREKAGDVVGQVKHQAGELGGRVRQGTRRAKAGLWETLEERPMAVGVGTLVLGLLAGLSIPSTRREDELMGETRDHLLDEAREAGREALEKGKEVARTTAETVKERAEGEGLTVSSLADKVRTVAHEAKEAAKQEAERQDLTPGKHEDRAPDAGNQARDQAPANVNEPELAKR